MPKLQQKNQLPPTILTIFGATGDLSADYLLPALLAMDEHGMLPKDFRLVAVGRRDLTTKQYFDFIVQKSSSLKKAPLAARKRFFKRLVYYRANFDDAASFKELVPILSDIENPTHKCFNRLYYFATSPQYFASIARMLKESGLLISCATHERKVRILVEKPFGFNYNSARDLNQLLLKFFSEDQIYRIDHYMGKETVQNLMVVRFANRLFEPLWNKDFIDRVEISVFEKDTAKTRAEYYDQTGALKDMVQNHILQMLSLIAMDEPKDLQTDLIRNEKAKVLEALSLPSPWTREGKGEGGALIIRAQYEGYKKDVKNPSSETETYVAVDAFVNLPRWQGVPFRLTTGKALGEKVTEISIYFKELDRCLFKNCAANILTFRIQPEEAVYMQINNKVPGRGVELHQAVLDFSYKKDFKGKLPSAYERLLLDFMEGDQRLFIRSDEIEAAWKFVDSVCAVLKEQPMYTYKKGSEGPKV